MKTILLISVLLVSPPLIAGTIRVDHSASGANDGSSWTNAFPTLQDALAVAVSGDEIQIAEGTYYPDQGGAAVTGDRASTFILDVDLSILGGYPTGGGTRDPEAHPTILSGDIGVGGDESDNTYHVLLLDDGNDATFQNILLVGLTITDGYADTDDGNDSHRGGGIFTRENLTLNQVTVSGNRATGDGGGLAIELGTSSFDGCLFDQNTSEGTGGGGAIRINDASINLSNCDFTGNQAIHTSGDGGALRTDEDSVLTIKLCHFENNDASESGGAIYCTATQPPTITNCSFEGNNATSWGGAILNDHTSPNITNCSFQGNSANSGGGISNNAGFPKLTNCSFQGNSANSGGGISNSFTVLTLTNCILWNNAQNGATNIPGASIKKLESTLSYRHCLVENWDAATLDASGSGGGNNLDGTDPLNDPLFILEVNPLTTSTTGGFLGLHGNSPVLNLGDDSANSELTDLAGYTRKIGTIDLGAYEQQGVLYVDETISGGDGLSWATAYDDLQDAINAASDGIEIQIAQGTYLPSAERIGGNARSVSFTLTEGILLSGGYPTGGGSQDPDTFPTILSGDLNQDDDTTGNTENAYHVLVLDDGDNATFQSVLLDGLTITGGHADLSSGSNHRGGGINTRENLTLTQVTISGNQATGYGGGIAIELGSHHFDDCTFSDNNSTGAGGGGAIRLNSATLTLINCDFTGNIADTNISADGGAIRTHPNSVLAIERCHFENNFALSSGGAIDCESTHSSTITYCSFLGNQAAFGGAMYNISSSPILTNCSFQGNKAGDHAGGIYNIDSSPSFTNCSFQGNNATGLGGGIYNVVSSPKLTNCILWNNARDSATNIPGASVSNFESTPTYSHCLIEHWDPTTLNTSGFGSTNNLDGTDPANDPLFVLEIDPLSAPTTGGDLRLRGLSPVINLGDDAANSELTDLAGNTRKIGTIDLGAYEQQGLLYVDETVSGGDGLSWATAYDSLQDAIAAVSSGQAILIAQGTYYPDEGTGQIDGDRNSTFALSGTVEVYGGHSTGGSTRNPDTFPTILSGDLNQDDDITGNSDNAYHVLLLDDGNDATIQNILLDGLTISDGNADTDDVNDNNRGGGIYTRENLILNQVIVSGNHAINYGGGIAIEIGDCHINDCTFSLNQTSSSGGGGAIFLNSATLALNNCELTDNRADSTTMSVGGGAILADTGAVLTIDLCHFEKNSTLGGRNSTRGSGDGGAIFCLATHPLEITNCSFQGNSAHRGGAVFYNTSEGKHFNGSFQGNHAKFGGGIYVYESSLSFANCSFQGNYATGLNSGGGVRNISNSSSDFTNCIIWKNATYLNEFEGTTDLPSASVQNSSTAFSTFSNCLVANSGGSTSWAPEIGTDLGNNIDADPLFVLEVDPLTAPHFVGDLRLCAGSPAVDAGDNAANSELTDLAGNPRIVDGNADTTATIDLGAYEVPFGIFAVTNFNDSGSGSLRDRISTSAAGSTITFDPSLDGGTISLTGGQLLIKQDLDLDASTLPNGLSIDAQQTSRVFEISSGSEVLLSDLTITGGLTPDGENGANGSNGGGLPGGTGGPGLPSDPGGGIYNAGTLTLNHVTLHACGTGNGGKGGNGGSGLILGLGGSGGTSGNGGGIFNAGTLAINNCTIVDNSTGNGGNGGGGLISGASGSGGDGGGIYNDGTLTIDHATITGNAAGTAGTGPITGTDGIGGGIFHASGDLTLSGTVLAENTAPGGSPDLDGTVFAYPTMNFIGDSTGATGLGTLNVDYLEGDPELHPLGNNGGPTLTRSPKPGSPLIDPTGGETTTVLITDQRGGSRLFGSTVDIGAVEVFTAYVDLAATGANDGSSWTDAYKHLQDALNSRAHPLEIRVAQGTYYPDEGIGQTDNDRTSRFLLVANAGMYGGYPTGGGSRDPDSYPSILGGDLLQDDHTGGDHSENAYHVVEGDGNTYPMTRDTVLDGFTVTGGNADSDFGTEGSSGGGIFLNVTSALIRNCSILENSAEFGGGVSVVAGFPLLENCTFQGNQASVAGGGMAASDGSFIATNCVFQGNYALESAAGIMNFGTSWLFNCTISGNRTEGGSGGIENFGVLNLTNCIIWNNQNSSGTSNASSSLTNEQSGSAPTLAYNLIQGHNPGGTNLDGTNPANDPLFVASAAPIEALAIEGDLRLLTGSPAVDAGDGISGVSANTTSIDLAGAPRFDGTIDLGAFEGSFDLTFALRYPTLDPTADENLNGVTNYGDYAAGGDPTAPDDPSLRPATNGSLVTFSYRNNAADVYTRFEKSPSLDPDSWTEMIEGTDYEDNPGTTIDGNRTLLTLDVFTPGSYLFFRQGFSTTPWP